MLGVSENEKSITVGRYQLHRKIARGGMATIHIAHLVGDVGFSRIVAAKRLHPELAQDRDFVAMFLDEARVASKVHHRNVVPVLDVVTMQNEVILVQDYVHGVPLSWLQRTLFEGGVRVPLTIAVSIACQVLAGLHAAHETTDELGTPLRIVHRDVSPQNVMIATDGTARLLDFGVAKAADASHVTRAGMFKGKIAYASPEQIRGKATRQSDIYAVAVMLWELLVGQRMNPSSMGQAEQIERILRGNVPRMADVLEPEKAWLGDDWERITDLQLVVDRGLAMDPLQRWATAVDMEAALVATVTPAPSSEVATWVKSVGKEFLDGRDKIIAAEEASWRRLCAATVATVHQGTALQQLPQLPRTTTAEQPPIAAAEPPTPSLRPQLLQQPLAMIGACALVGVALAFGIAFLGRDVESPRRAAAARMDAASTGDHTVARPVEPTAKPVATPIARPITRPVAKAIVTPVEPVLQIAPVVKRPPPEVPARPKPAPQRQVVRKAPQREPVARKKEPPPPPPPAPVRPERSERTERAPMPPPAGNCNPPYYFVGDKKMFKPSCV